VVRAARRGGMRGPVSARRAFAAAAGGDARAMAVVAEEVVDGRLAAGTELAWGQLMTVLPTAPSPS
jgi:hypothetical protein